MLCVLVSSALADTLEGRVVEDHTGNPIVSAEVRATRIGQTGLAAELETDSEGRFRAPDLASGEYRVEISKPNYAGATLRLRLPAASLQMRLVRLGAITGQVIDARGQGVRGGRVFVMVKPPEGGPLRPFGSSVAVNESGQYRVFGLPPGQYAVALSYATFNPGAASGAYYYPVNGQPQFFSVSGGDEYRGVDFSISGGSRYRISGKVAAPESVARFALSLFPADQPSLAVVNQWTEKDGSFRLEGIPAGSYDLVASGPATGSAAQASLLGSDPLFGRIHIEVGGGDVEDVSIPVSEGRTVSFMLRTQGNGACPRSASLALTPLEALGSMEGRTIEATVGREEKLDNLSPGRYQVVVSKLGDGCYCASSPIVDLRGGEPDGPIEVVIASAGSIRGKLNAGLARPEDFAVALLGAESAVQVAYPDAEGRFGFAALRPGRYWIAAQTSKTRWVQDLSRMFEIEIAAGAPTDVDLSPLPPDVNTGNTP
jgi:hypothetical protein